MYCSLTMQIVLSPEHFAPKYPPKGAHDFQERLMQDPDLTVPAIASQERLTIGYLSRLLRPPSLAPDIVTAIINGKHPPELSAKRLMRLALKLPTDWVEQRKLLGFQRV